MNRVICSLLIAFVSIPAHSATRHPIVAASSTGGVSTTGESAVRDPEALKILNAAVTALGGSTAILQNQSWTFTATMQGGLVNRDVTYGLTSDLGKADQITAAVGTLKDGQSLPVIRSLFVPAIISSVLAKQVADNSLSIQYLGSSTLGKTAVEVVSFLPAGEATLAHQTWFIDAATSLPIRVDLTSPAIIGSKMSFVGPVYLSNYQSIGGVLYPFRILTRLPGVPPEIITLKNVAPSAATPANALDISAGDLQ